MFVTDRRHLRGLLAASLCTVAAGFAAPVVADPISLSPEPPELLKGAVVPNMMVTLDDSGSMARAYMPDSVGERSRIDPDAGTTGAGTIHERAFYYSGANSLYYNPTTLYTPPTMPDGVTHFPDASYTNAWRDGFCANLPTDGTLGARCTATRVNLQTSFYIGFDSAVCQTPNQAARGAACTYSDDASGPAGTSNLLSARDIPAAPRRNLLNIAVTGGFYHELNNGTLRLVDVNLSSAAQQQNFANWYSYYRTRKMMAIAGVSGAFAELQNPVRVSWQNLNANLLASGSSINLLAATQRANFFKWLYNVPANGGTPNRSAMERVGNFFRGNYQTAANNDTNPYWEFVTGASGGGLELTCRQNFHLLVTDGYWTNTAVSPVAPVPTAAATLPSNKAYTPNTPNTRVYSAQSTANNGNASPSLADQAFALWATDLKPNLDNEVPTYLGDSTIGVTNATPREIPLDPFTDDEIYFNPANDPATWQHVVQYTVGLGVSGVLPGADVNQRLATLNNLRRGTAVWPLPNNDDNGDLRKLDDTWRAAVVSRGTFFSVTKPTDLKDGIAATLRSATSSRQAKSSTPSIGSPVLSAGGSAFLTGYNSAGWSGQLTRQVLNEQGVLGAMAWRGGGGDAGNILTATAPASRRIFTSRGGNGPGRAFQQASLSAAQLDVLNKAPTAGSVNAAVEENPANWTTVDNLAAQRIAYIRGDRSAETAAPNFRVRRSLLGAVIVSQPLYVSSPGGLADDFPPGSPESQAGLTAYENFVNQYRNRPPTVYVGSNDGMLHAFDAVNGSERWAFIPNTLIENGRMTRMTRAIASLVPGADDSPIAGEAFFPRAAGSPAAWGTVLIGSLRLGGRGIYALDITDPSATNENQAAGKFLWEFSNKNADASRLGYTYSSANIVRLNNGKWGVVVASGYFPTEGLDSNDPAAGDSRTSLFVLDITDGSIIRELRTPTSVRSFGLSTPAAFDYDSNRTTDVVVAGDLAGNLWRFDMADATPANWTVTQMFKTYETAADIGKQPISVMPVALEDRVSRTPVWIFGTGKYLGRDDSTTVNLPRQFFYGVRDYGATAPGGTYPIVPSQLTAQTITDTGDQRNSTSLPVAANAGGWKFQLIQGERNVVTASPLRASNLAVLSTLIPLAGFDPCESTNRGALMVVDAGTGGASSQYQAGGRRGNVGVIIDNPPGVGSILPLGVPQGGGKIIVPGLDASVEAQYWRRESWREMFNNYELR